MNDEQYMYWLTTVDGMTLKRAAALIERFGSAEGVYGASRESLMKIPQMTPELADAVASSKNAELVIAKTAEFEKKGIRLLAISNPEYPELLREIYDPPLLLYVKGRLPGAKLPMVAVIGSRNCSDYGLNAAYKLSKDLALRGVVIVSGMARGIDGMAHKGAMDANPPDGGASTVAVLGCGVDVCYPADNHALYDRLARDGCIISEYPPGTEPLKYNFPQRNRIISGLSLGVIVVEAAVRSGTSITVDMALEQGRDVFVVPGSIFSRLSEGTNAMIKNGAVPITGYDDVLWAIRRRAGLDNAAALGNETAGGEHNINCASHPALANDENMLYACIGLDPVHIDELLVKTGLGPQDAQYILMKLELSGLVKKLPGQTYSRVV